MAATVTIDRSYFETLLRRADLHTSERALTTPGDIPVVSVPKLDHDNLLRMAHEYMSLRDALYNGGIAPETLETLIRGEGARTLPTNSFNHDEPLDGGVNIFADPTKAHVTIPQPHSIPYDQSGFRWPSLNSFNRWGSWTGYNSYPRNDGSFTPDLDLDEGFLAVPRLQKQQYARTEQRTIIARNLSDRVTYNDIVNFVRGGIVVDIYLRKNERSANISFVEGSAAQDFMNHVKRNDIYIHGRRASAAAIELEFAWNDRQFVLPGHVANKISIGATRNIVIRGVHPDITEERLREDLDHIHNLVVIGIFYETGDAHISLNSIHNSLFARTCLMSRAAYKGMRIEWYADECAQPLPEIQYLAKKENTARPALKTPSSMMNRFQLLNLDGDGTEDGTSTEDGENELVVLSDSSLGISHRSPWNSRAVAA